MKVEEAYVSFEVAKLLKEKGFDTHCSLGWSEQSYDKNDPRFFSINFDKKEYWISCPTQQMAMRWLREVHTMGITIGAANTYKEGVGYYWHITDNHPGVKWLSRLTYCKTYEEAAEAAIKYCLENLIKND